MTHELRLLYRRFIKRDKIERELQDELHAFAADIVSATHGLLSTPSKRVRWR